MSSLDSKFSIVISNHHTLRGMVLRNLPYGVVPLWDDNHYYHIIIQLFE